MMENRELEPEGQISLRPVTENDREFLIRVISDLRQGELALTGWDYRQKRIFIEHQLHAQTTHYLAVYPGSTHEIICWNGGPAGRLFTDRGPKEIAILDITVLTEFRRRGIGTALITGLQAEANRDGRSVRIYLESFNPSRVLFEKLGFKVTGQQEHNLKYVWQP
jgi:ribosomal protein S18 acetylase RimI-like enzyme